MSGFYRFPAISWLEECTATQQHDCIDGELYETRCALLAMDHARNDHERCGARIAYGMELMDVIHAAETALRMEFADEEAVCLRYMVEKKNRDRRYYSKPSNNDDDADWGEQ